MSGTKIVCAGLGKTGTTSFAAAMEFLGYQHCDFSRRLYRKYQKGRVDYLMQVLRRNDSVSDYPWPLILDEILETEENVRLVLTRRRDPDTWVRSLKSHAERGGASPEFRHLFYTDNRMASDSALRALYTEHIEYVRALAARTHTPILEVCWESGDGWNELCPFLGCSIPTTAFPHENRTDHSPLSRRLVNWLNRVRNRLR